VNGDGYSDVLVGANGYDSGQTDEGRAFVYYGNDGPCRVTKPFQLNPEGGAPIAILGASGSETEFWIGAINLSIYGRTRIQMESEVKPRGVLFDGLDTTLGAFWDTGDDGALPYERLIHNLTPGTQYHWRVRTAYDLARTPFQRHGPWVHVPVNGWNEADLRTAGDAATGVDAAAAARQPLLVLETPRPNPFERSTVIGYSLPHRDRVRLAVYDVAGRQRVVLVDGVQEAGRQVAGWNGRGRDGSPLPAGVYFVRLAFGDRVESRKIVITR
jgi:hypothetical protein